MKRSMIPVLVVLVLCLVGFGFYRNWFALSSPSPEAGSHKVNINLMLDPDKVKADAEAVRKKSTERDGNFTEGANDFEDRTTDSR